MTEQEQEQEIVQLRKQIDGLSKMMANRIRTELRQVCGAKPQTITCQDCGLNGTCEFAWDHYNTDGDCLAEK